MRIPEYVLQKLSFPAISQNWHEEKSLTENNKFKCDQCLKSYKQKVDMQKHKSAKHGKFKYQCTIPGCTRFFDTKTVRNKHSEVTNQKYHIPGRNQINFEEGRNKQGRFKCDECSLLNNAEKKFA